MIISKARQITEIKCKVYTLINDFNGSLSKYIVPELKNFSKSVKTIMDNCDVYADNIADIIYNSDLEDMVDDDKCLEIVCNYLQERFVLLVEEEFKYDPIPELTYYDKFLLYNRLAEKGIDLGVSIGDYYILNGINEYYNVKYANLLPEQMLAAITKEFNGEKISNMNTYLSTDDCIFIEDNETKILFIPMLRCDGII